MGRVAKGVSMERCIGCDLCLLACSRENAGTLSLHDSFIRIQKERQRFLAAVDSGRCNACGACVKICPRGCLNL